MAIQAKFVADFSSFSDAVKGAESDLKKFEASANTAGKTVNRMVDQFSGRKLIQDAIAMSAAIEKIGGTSKLTEKELQRVASTAAEAASKMKALGIDVPPKVQALANQVTPLPGMFGKVTSAVSALGGVLGLAFTGTAIVAGITRQISASLEYADSLAKLKARTDLTYRDLQVLENVGISTGVSIESLANAVQILQMRLGDGSAKKGLTALRIGFDDIKKLSPGEQFAAIGAAIAKIEDPIERARVASIVFGRSWKEIVPALKANMADIAKATKFVGDAQIDAADRGGDKWEQFWRDQKRGWASWAGDILLNMEKGMASFDEANRRAKEIRGGASRLPDLPTAPGSRTNRGPFVNDVDPEMISNLKVYGMTLEETAKAAVKTAEAERVATKVRTDFLEISKAGLGPLYDWQAQVLLTKFKTDQLTVSETALREEVETLADFVARHKGEMFPEPPPGSLEKWKEGQTTIRETLPYSVVLSESLMAMGRSFEQMGNIAGESMSKVARGMGTLISAFDIGRQGLTSLKSGFAALGDGGILKGIMGVVSGIGGIASAASAAISVVKGLWNGLKKLFGGQPNSERDDWFGGRGVQDIGDQLAPFMDGEQARKMIEAVFNAKTKDQLSSATGAIDNILNSGSSSITDREGLGFAGGTRGKYLDFGSGTPVTLHGKERVMTEAEGRNESGWGGITINVHGSVISERELAQIVNDANERNYRTKNYVRAA